MAQKHISKSDWTESNIKELAFVIDNITKFDGSITMKISAEGNLSVVSIDDGPGNPTALIVCNQSGNVAFARCVGNYLEAHPGECLKVWHDDSGNHADNECDTP